MKNVKKVTQRPLWELRREVVKAISFLAEDFSLPEYSLPFTLLQNGNSLGFNERVSRLDWRTSSDPRTAYLFHSIFSKADFLELPVDLEWNTLLKFYTAEERCLNVNRKFSSLHEHDVTLKSGTSLRTVIFIARREIARVLGEFDVDRWVEACNFGPGAAIGVPRKVACPANKIGHLRPTVTQDATLLASYLIGYNFAWFRQHVRDGVKFRTADAEQLIMVPKNSEYHRIIGKPPLLNQFLQAGIGRLIRERLLTKAKINLNDQSINQQLAYQGSKDRASATLDMSMASDTNAYGLVDMLLPRDWFRALVRVRVPKGELESGEVIDFAKFSAMGNGYTFELESLIFYALARAVAVTLRLGDRPLNVYGDDIVCPSEMVEELGQVLEELGFKVNLEKSFWGADPFRESCGKHYLDGDDVTPFFIRSLSSPNSRITLAANNLRRWGGYPGKTWDPRINRAWSHLVSLIDPRYTRSRIPDGLGDGALVGPRTEAAGGVRYSRETGGFVCSARLKVPVTGKPLREDHAYLAELLGRSKGGGPQIFSPPGLLTGVWKLRKLAEFYQRQEARQRETEPGVPEHKETCGYSHKTVETRVPSNVPW